MLLILHDIDRVLILEHSFHLFQQDIPRPFLTAAQQYKASSIPAKIRKALVEVVKQYDKLSDMEKVDMVSNIILQNCMGNVIYLLKFYSLNSISEIPAYT